VARHRDEGKTGLKVWDRRPVFEREVQAQGHDDMSKREDTIALAASNTSNNVLPFVARAGGALQMCATLTLTSAAEDTLNGELGSNDDAGPSSSDASNQAAGAPLDIGRIKQHDLLIRLTERVATLFNTGETDDGGYADVVIDGHRETMRVKAGAFSRLLRKLFLDATDTAPTTEAVRIAINTIDAKAQFQEVRHKVHLRVAEHGGYVYLDLCDPQWRAVEVSPIGWKIVGNPPVRFRRHSGMLSLPDPVHGGSVELLRPFLNVEEDGFVLAVSWLLACLRAGTTYPVLALSGEQGSAKSSFLRALRSLVDPNKAMLRSLARDEHDLFISADNGYVLAFDNDRGRVGIVLRRRPSADHRRAARQRRGRARRRTTGLPSQQAAHGRFRHLGKGV
jgi:hypothetical protein